MKLTTEDITATRKKLTVLIEGETITSEKRTLLGQYRKSAKIPGFRPGKAPDSLIQQRYGRELRDDLKQRLIGQAYRHMTEEAKLDLVDIIEMDDPDFSSAEDTSFTMTVDVNAEFEVPAYDDLTAEAPGVEVEDGEIEDALLNIRRQHAAFNPIERAAEPGDYVQVTYLGKIGDDEIATLVPDNPVWGTQNKTWEEAGADAEQNFGVKAVIEGIVGMGKGDTKEVEHVFADDFQIEALAGKTATYSLEVFEVRERVLPELTDDFVKQLQVESVEDLKARIMDQLEGQKEQERSGSIRRQIRETLLGRVEFPVPESSLDRETERIVQSIMRDNMQRGVPQEALQEHSEELFTNARQQGERELQFRQVLRKVAEAEEITVEQEDMQRMIMAEAMQTRTSPDEIVKALQADSGRLNELRTAVLMNKTLDFLVDKTTVTTTDGEAADSNQ